jgi:hypothetical protein
VQLDYLDALPFPAGDIDAHRGRVCDFCFYGGPDKATPKADWHPA